MSYSHSLAIQPTEVGVRPCASNNTHVFLQYDLGLTITIPAL